MSGYAIMRCKKLATMGSVASSLQHCYRDRETPNADATRTPENEHHAAQSTTEAMGKLRELLPEKRRKDAVLAVEYVMTASPEWWKSASQQQQAEFFTRSKQWLADKYGADRIVTASIHRDEASPHLSAFVVPLTQDGRLSAKEFIGGRQKMRDDQTSYAQRVADLSLERGIEGSRATHQTVKSYYAAIQRESGHALITPGALEPRRYKAQGLAEKLGLMKRVEAPEAVAERLTAAVRAGYAPAIQAAAGARQERQKAKQAQDTARDLRERLNPVLDALGPLNEANRAKVAAIIKVAGEKALAEQQRDERVTKLDAEKRRRIGALPALERRTAGAAQTFAQHAQAALAKAGGNASQVEWTKVEGAAAREAISKLGQDPKKVARAICEHSPARANPSVHAKVMDWVQEKAPDWQQQYKAQHGHSKSRGVEL